jgi:hypothetical protein
MQAATSMRAKLSSTLMAANWQTLAQVPQSAHSSASTWATYPDDAIVGVPFCCACIAPQPFGYAQDRQREQQLQMAQKRPSMASLW